MATDSQPTHNSAGNPYQLAMLVLCVVALIQLAVTTLVPIDASTREVLEYGDFAICIVFLFDFIQNVIRAENRREYLLRWGWIDLLSSIPAIDLLRVGRAARILRILRVLRGVRATKIVTTFLVNRRQGTMSATLLGSLFLIVLASLAVLQFEDVEGANIRSAEDAVWWAVTTLTTVGYGDRFPVSTEGRIIAIVLMTAGIGLYGTMSGLVAAWFLDPMEEEREDEMRELRTEVRELRVLLERIAQERVPSQS